MKTYVLMLSKHFPKHFKHDDTKKQTNFKELIQNGNKIHTIRANYKLWAARAKEVNRGLAFVSVREWSGLPYRSKQKEIFRFYKIGIEEICMTYFDGNGLEVSVNDYYLYASNKVKLSKNDGLGHCDFINWFFPNRTNGSFQGVIIHFTDFRYYFL